MAVWVIIWRCDRTLRTLDRHAAAAWAQLTSLLDQRHLVISHLVDAAEDLLGDQTCDLADACQAARATLQSPGQWAVPNVDLIAERERGLQQELDRLTEMIADRVDLGTREAINSCLAGLSRLNEQTKVAHVTYNDAAITHTTFVNTKLASLLHRLTHSRTRYPMIDWFSSSSSSESSRLPPYQPQ
jgi:hypothetical protein